MPSATHAFFYPSHPRRTHSRISIPLAKALQPAIAVNDGDATRFEAAVSQSLLFGTIFLSTTPFLASIGSQVEELRLAFISTWTGNKSQWMRRLLRIATGAFSISLTRNEGHVQPAAIRSHRVMECCLL